MRPWSKPALGYYNGFSPMERIAKLFEEGAIRPPETKLFRLSQAVEAHRLSQSRHFRGKLVFEVR